MFVLSFLFAQELTIQEHMHSVLSNSLARMVFIDSDNSIFRLPILETASDLPQLLEQSKDKEFVKACREIAKLFRTGSDGDKNEVLSLADAGNKYAINCLKRYFWFCPIEESIIWSRVSKQYRYFLRQLAKYGEIESQFSLADYYNRIIESFKTNPYFSTIMSKRALKIAKHKKEKWALAINDLSDNLLGDVETIGANLRVIEGKIRSCEDAIKEFKSKIEKSQDNLLFYGRKLICSVSNLSKHCQSRENVLYFAEVLENIDQYIPDAIEFYQQKLHDLAFAEGKYKGWERNDFALEKYIAHEFKGLTTTERNQKLIICELRAKFLYKQKKSGG